MKVNTIPRNNYSIKTNNNSKPAFKGKNFAGELEKFDFSRYLGDLLRDRVFLGIKDLFLLASKEPGFKVEDRDLYQILNNTEKSNNFWDLFDQLYKNRNVGKKATIATDSQGPLIIYGRKPGLLEFTSGGQCVSIGFSKQHFGTFHIYTTTKQQGIF